MLKALLVFFLSVRSLFILFFLVIATAAPGVALPPVPGIESHLTDKGRVLSDADRESIDRSLGSIQQDTKVDVAVVILDFPAEPLPEMAQAIFQTWSIGRSWEGGGMLVVVSQDLKECAIATTDKDIPLPAQLVRQLEEVLRTLLEQRQLAVGLRSVVSRIHRAVSARRPHAEAPRLRFEPDTARIRNFSLGLLVTGLLSVLSYKGRRWR